MTTILLWALNFVCCNTSLPPLAEREAILLFWILCHKIRRMRQRSKRSQRSCYANLTSSLLAINNTIYDRLLHCALSRMTLPILYRMRDRKWYNIMPAKIFRANIVYVLRRTSWSADFAARNSAIFHNRGTHVKTRPHLRAASTEGCWLRMPRRRTLRERGRM